MAAVAALAGPDGGGGCRVSKGKSGQKRPAAGPATLGDVAGPALGYWVDLQIPELAGVLPEGVDAGKFTAWFSPRVVAYRSRMIERDLLPTPAEELKVMKRLGAALYDLQALLSPGAIPPRAWAALGAWAFKNDYDWHALVDQIGRAHV